MRIMWIVSRLLPDACRVMGYQEHVVGGWMQSQLAALQKKYEDQNEYFVLASDVRPCDIQLGNVHYRSFGRGNVIYDKGVPHQIKSEIQKSIRDFEPDVIHIHGTEFFYGSLTPSVYCGKPTVVSLQGILQGYHSQVTGLLAPKEVFWHQFNIRRFLRGSTIFKEQTFWREKRLPQEEAVFAIHSNFMGRTSWDQAWTKALNPNAKYFHVNETLRDVFYSGVQRLRGNIRPHSIYCSAAAGYPLKGAHILIRAVAFLKKAYPDISVRICAAEKITKSKTLISFLKADQYTSYLRKLICKFGLQNNIVGLPKLNANNVAEELSRAEIFVLPSLCENSPNSLGEAQLIGTPAIATFVGGTPSVLRDGIDGRLVPSGDSAALADMIDWYFSHPIEADAYAASAREVASFRHDPTQNAEATMKVYRSIIQG